MDQFAKLELREWGSFFHCSVIILFFFVGKHSSAITATVLLCYDGLGGSRRPLEDFAGSFNKYVMKNFVFLKSVFTDVTEVVFKVN